MNSAELADSVLAGGQARCTRCAGAIGAGAPVVYLHRMRADGRVTPSQSFHAACAPLWRGKLLQPGFFHTLPAKVIANERVFTAWGAHGWRLDRTLPGGQLITFTELFDRHATRDLLAHRLRRARKIVLDALADMRQRP